MLETVLHRLEGAERQDCRQMRVLERAGITLMQASDLSH